MWCRVLTIIKMIIIDVFICCLKIRLMTRAVRINEELKITVLTVHI